VRPKYCKIFPRLIPVAIAAALTACSTLGVPSAKNKEMAETHLQLGSRYLSLNKLEIAKENLLQAVSDDPTNAQAHNALAFLYEKIKQLDDAEDEYETAQDLAPDDFGIQNNYGRFLCEQGKTEKAMPLLTAAGSNPLNDRSWLALTNAGRCLLNSGDKQKAEAYFRQALEAKKDYAPTLSAMQKISYEKGDLWAAKGFFERYGSVAAHTPETLFIAVHTERALGNLGSAKEYRNLLLEKFPISNEAAKIRPVFQ
jgi:type IV pilus assembly protein PilF